MIQQFPIENAICDVTKNGDLLLAFQEITSKKVAIFVSFCNIKK